MPLWIGKAYLTAGDLERERAYVRNLRFGNPEPLRRRVACRLFHLRHHAAARWRGRVACRCRRCGHGWTEDDRSGGMPDGPFVPRGRHRFPLALQVAAAPVPPCLVLLLAAQAATGRAWVAAACLAVAWPVLAVAVALRSPAPGGTGEGPR